jgi:hypothetical protein
LGDCVCLNQANAIPLCARASGRVYSLPPALRLGVSDSIKPLFLDQPFFGIFSGEKDVKVSVATVSLEHHFPETAVIY